MMAPDKRSTLIVLSLVLLGLPALSHAFGSGDVGTTGAQFLQIGPGARQAAMGEAFAGVADDIHSIYYNPAGLGNLSRVEVTGMHNQQFQGINYEFAAVSVPLLSWSDSKLEKNMYGVLGFAMYNLNVGRIERRGTTETDAPSDTFNSSDFAYALSYGYAFPETGLSLGVTGKLIDINLDSFHATGFAADAGGLYRMRRLSIGMGLRNGGSVRRLSSTTDPLPLTLYSGVGYRLTDHLLAAMDIDLPKSNNAQLAFGGEYSYPFTDKITGSLRAGYNMRTHTAGGVSGSSFGMGVGYYNFMFDFAWVPYGDLGNTFRYSLHVKF